MFFWQKAKKKKQDENATETKSTNCPWSSYVLLQLVPSAKCAPGVGNMYGQCCCRSFSIVPNNCTARCYGGDNDGEDDADDNDGGGGLVYMTM